MIFYIFTTVRKLKTLFLTNKDVSCKKCGFSKLSIAFFFIHIVCHLQKSYAQSASDNYLLKDALKYILPAGQDSFLVMDVYSIPERWMGAISDIQLHKKLIREIDTKWLVVNPYTNIEPAYSRKWDTAFLTTAMLLTTIQKDSMVNDSIAISMSRWKKVKSPKKRNKIVVALRKNKELLPSWKQKIYKIQGPWLIDKENRCLIYVIVYKLDGTEQQYFYVLKRNEFEWDLEKIVTR
jgi:hypothetical protein